jgi:predicted CXXCH cytochrome family protein
VRRMTLLLAGGAVWLFLAAIPALADNGPHMQDINSGAAGINADTCAGCHRAHTAQSVPLTIQGNSPNCFVCHGPSGAGATTNVVDGIQYATTAHAVVAGALRGGGFAQARIGTGSATRYSYSVPIAFGRGFTGLVPVASTGTTVTSAHMNVNGSAWGPSIAWGNGPESTTGFPGPAVSITCTTCHNPHGNGKYRILNPVPAPEVAPSATFVPAPTAANVADVAPVPTGQTRNYTNPPAQYLSQLASDTNPRDYWRYCTPQWNSCSGTNRGEKPNGLSPTTFATQISAWCSTCHTRYLATGSSAEFPTTDTIYTYRHTTTVFPQCTQCHVSHGSNAEMTGYNSTHVAYPNTDGTGGTYSPFASTGSTDSRLLKIDNRGTCQMCHDPTGTITTVGVTSPTAAP